MGEGLGEVSEMFAGGTEFFGVEADVVGVAEHLFENEAALQRITGTRETFGIPEGAHAEGAFLARKTIRRRATDAVTMHERVFDQFAFNRFHGREPASIYR